MTTRRLALFATASLPALAPSTAAAADWPGADEIARRVAEVTATESAFAKTLADRDPAAFRHFLAADTIWLNGRQPLHGPDAVMAAWARFFDGPKAPFAWVPELVVVLPSGELAQSSGPVTRPDDGLVTARFQSVWRRRPAGGWEIVFDQGSEVCS
ncbi:YybH family protein [Roseateles cellulosilyticus]|uniref:Nuclear transport factor 2 family protein n=1 Tax=Pelomonas cellulosilytica TaxID=2906762 RepID=A0ABS8XR36_9BURK|nr:nuclear transport factor 2 family protein [Pelomonas sp. P8]MCE4555204.1 nuclear transport factor 2 family protein [Pelomonas sp. P8]